MENTYSICKSCFDNLHFIKDGCVKCGKPIIHHTLELEDISGCSNCLKRGYYFDRAISCIEYDKISKKMIIDFKYKNKTYYSKYIANIIKEKLDIENIKADYIIPVPLHKKRLKKRGFNQAEKIAIKLEEILDIPILDCIYRSENTKRLYSLNKKQRETELKNAFKTKENINYIKNKNVIILDDIFTTGSTANEMSKLLRLACVNKIYVVTLLTRAIDNYIKE